MDRADARVVVALSGGVDSSVAAALLQRQGFEVVGVTFQVTPEESPGKGSSCASQQTYLDAAKVAEALGISHQVVDLRDAFESSIIAEFVSEYASGRTPNPCVSCNKTIKFRSLLDAADACGAAWIATGHYARVQRSSEGGARLLRASSLAKDQSYVLYRLGQQELGRALFPLGDITKNDTRTLARHLELPVWEKPESQEICFVGPDRYLDFIVRRNPGIQREGKVVDTSGRVLGSHGGTAGFTIGQRKGIGIAASMPLYVVEIDASTNTIVVGAEQELFASAVVVDDLSWVSGVVPGSSSMAVSAKVRYNMPDVPAKLAPLPDGRCRLTFKTAERAPTPGQAAVFYNGEIVLGGGTIVEVHRK